MTATPADNTQGKCGHCGMWHDLTVMCWRVKAVEYKPDGTVRYEYHDAPLIPSKLPN